MYDLTLWVYGSVTKINRCMSKQPANGITKYARVSVRQQMEPIAVNADWLHRHPVTCNPICWLFRHTSAKYIITASRSTRLGPNFDLLFIDLRDLVRVFLQQRFGQTTTMMAATTTTTTTTSTTSRGAPTTTMRTIMPSIAATVMTTTPKGDDDHRRPR